MRHGSLFSGIGGFDLAAEWMGWENVFHCEWNEFGQRVLHHYWPDAVQLGDITKAKFKRDERGDVWIRVSGIVAYDNSIIRREGRDDKPEKQPRYGKGITENNGWENGEKDEWINIGPIDIITGGFPCQPFSMAGKRKGTADDRHLWPEMLRAIREIQPTFVVGENVPGLINWDGGLVFDQVQTDLEAQGYEVIPFVLPACGVNAPHRRDRVWFVGHSQCLRRTGGKVHIENELETLQGRKTGTFITEGKNGITPDTDSSQRFKGGLHKAGSNEATRYTCTRNTRINGRGTWDNFPTQPPVRGRNDGISPELAGITVSKHRNESIKAYGNAVVPQVVYQIYKSIDQFMVSTCFQTLHVPKHEI